MEEGRREKGKWNDGERRKEKGEWNDGDRRMEKGKWRKESAQSERISFSDNGASIGKNGETI